MTPQERQTLIQVKKAEIVALQKDVTHLIRTCSHQIIQKSSSAVCEICQTHFGWYCPESPDHICHYAGEIKHGEQQVRLLNGQIVKAPEGHRHYWEDCLFCGEPDERK